jgi:hypothetical protein
MATSDEIDFELIGAFMDGRLAGAERDRVVKLLAENEAAFEVYTDALRARTDVGDGSVVSLATRRERHGRWWWVTMAPMAAAAVLLVAVLPTIQARRDVASFDASTTAIALPLTQGADLANALQPGWEDREWSVTRGGGSAVVDSTTAFRLGVRATDLHVTLSAGDVERAGRVTAEILDLLESEKFVDPVKAEYSGLRSRIAQGEARAQLILGARGAEETMDEVVDSRWLGFGKWFAAGELAARVSSAPFFESSATSRFLDAAIEHGELAPGDVELLRQVAVLAEQGVEGEEFETIRQKFAELIRRHGG